MRCMPPRYYANATVYSQPHFYGVLLDMLVFYNTIIYLCYIRSIYVIFDFNVVKLSYKNLGKP